MNTAILNRTSKVTLDKSLGKYKGLDMGQQPTFIHNLFMVMIYPIFDN